MEETLPTALAITAIGMTLLFLTLGLFYGLLGLMTSAIRDRSPERAAALPEGNGGAAVAPAGPDPQVGARQRAAAVAVALARAQAEVLAGAQAEALAGFGLDTDSSIRDEAAATGAWWALHHGRRLAAPPSPWRG